ncbi:efflux RND transporter periplasmic adaptor subunit [Paracoccus sp. R12_1]|uniref:efflux RND transporter periplasmic adaptor subunit n=1 Tax=unclassified Paracoccus (in: a-proteobacteria) TaxID=2688777 RepID=UPI001ADD3E09|nr:MULTISPECIES: efflux RND transporter periplasmic adaptor subunit [unclassified Paracoccus (in: a-proteobacteria)]MBO9455399.1 efflux RND transporter periplasmic adaptor subunit [Paracoccus sp. R12_2]MBO9485879.1 efflux RND transporter periplasmic adaptor subunit [Paracoccus sp. R12_1]
MPNPRHAIRLAILALLTFSGIALAQEAPPKQVGVVTLQRQDVPRIVTVPGRAVAAARAGIRPRVGGIITGILYDEGRPLKAGDPMFRIDDTTYAANLSSAEAQVASARAALTEAETSFNRTQQLLGSGTTQAQVDAARATLEQARAALQSAQAAQRLAQADLDWTTVTSPIDGMASVSEVSVGDLVTAGQADALATVTQLDPIEVDMYEPSARMLRVFEDITEGRLQMRDKLQATLTLETGQTYEATGELVAPGFSVSTSTGSVDTRFRFDNPRRLLLPGMFVRGQVDLGTVSAFLVSQSAASRDKTGTLTAWVIKDGKATQRRLTEDGTWQNNWIVTQGIEPGDMLAVDGLDGLTEGAEVQTVAVEFGADGVVREVAPDPKAGAQNATDADQPAE